MNSLINKLNVKTVSFDNVGSGNFNIVTPSDVAAALSYSQMPQISHDLIRAKYLNENSVDKIEAIAIALMQAHFPKTQHNDLLKTCAIVAIVEFCKVPADYKPSIRKRAMILGVAKTTYCRMKLDNFINQFSLLLNDYYAVGRAKLGRQFASFRIL